MVTVDSILTAKVEKRATGADKETLPKLAPAGMTTTAPGTGDSEPDTLDVWLYKVNVAESPAPPGTTPVLIRAINSTTTISGTTIDTVSNCPMGASEFNPMYLGLVPRGWLDVKNIADELQSFGQGRSSHDEDDELLHVLDEEVELHVLDNAEQDVDSEQEFSSEQDVDSEQDFSSLSQHSNWNINNIICGQGA